MSSSWVHNGSPELDAKSQYPEILAVCICLTAIMMITVGLRFYVRAVMLKTIGMDDWIILFSAICSIIYSGLCIGQSKWGLGLDLSSRPKENLNNYSIINFVGRPFYMAGITGFKAALCLSYLRILTKSSKFYQTVVWTVLVTCVLSHLAGTFVLIFQCKPVRRSWIPLTPGSCLRNDITFYALAAVTILFDCIIFFLPIPILLQLQINTRRKMALILVFMLGLFTTICSIMRMVQIITIAKTGNSTMLILWGTVEMNVGIALTCIPTLTPLFTFFREMSTVRHGYGHGSDRRTGEHGNSLNVLKSRNTNRTTEISSGRWEDCDSDNSSQRGIIGLKSSLADHDTAATLGSERAGITATMTVEVQVSEAEHTGKKEAFQRQEQWGGLK